MARTNLVSKRTLFKEIFVRKKIWPKLGDKTNVEPQKNFGAEENWKLGRKIFCWMATLDSAILDSAILDSTILDSAILDSAILDSSILESAFNYLLWKLQMGQNKLFRVGGWVGGLELIIMLTQFNCYCNCQLELSLAIIPSLVQQQVL